MNRQNWTQLNESERGSNSRNDFSHYTTLYFQGEVTKAHDVNSRVDFFGSL